MAAKEIYEAAKVHRVNFSSKVRDIKFLLSNMLFLTTLLQINKGSF